MLLDFLFRHADLTPDDTAVIDDSGRHTHRAMAAAAAALSRLIGDRTHRPHAGILLPPSAGYVASFYGILLSGKSVVPLNYLLGDRDIAHVIRDSGIDTVATAPPLSAKLQDCGLNLIDLSRLPAAAPQAAPAPPRVGTGDLAVLMYTSGTTGLPKGVMLSYGNLQSDVDAAIDHVGLQRKHTFLGIIPLFHSFGMTATMLAPMQLASPIVYLPRFSPLATIEAIRAHKPSILFGIPSMFAAMLHLQSTGPEDFAGFHAIISGGEALPATVREAFLQRFQVPIYEGYGLTETSPVTHVNVPHDHRPGSVGKPVPGCETRIVDDQDNPLPPERPGEIWLKGPMIMKGYYNLPEETARVLTPDGYFKTGDLGRIDKDGFLFITGRKKDIIIAAGEKIVPREVEELLMAHPEVAEAAVVGRKDSVRGEAVVAFVVARPGASLDAEALRSFCRQQGLANFKIPRDIHLIDQLPHTPTGKVLKRDLRARADAQAQS